MALSSTRWRLGLARTSAPGVAPARSPVAPVRQRSSHAGVSCRPKNRGPRSAEGRGRGLPAREGALVSCAPMERRGAGAAAGKREFPPVADQMELLTRGAVDLVDEAQLRAKLERSARTGEPLTVKTGFDPSTPDLHLGHTVLLRKMRHFQQLGHRVVFLIGDFTALIGDPTGKKTTRPQLSPEEVEANAKTYQRQVWKVLDERETVVDHNSRWLLALGSAGLVRLAGRYTLARMMERS